jgi:hypothetical protein
VVGIACAVALCMLLERIRHEAKPRGKADD